MKKIMNALKKKNISRDKAIATVLNYIIHRMFITGGKIAIVSIIVTGIISLVSPDFRVTIIQLIAWIIGFQGYDGCGEISFIMQLISIIILSCLAYVAIKIKSEASSIGYLELEFQRIDEKYRLEYDKVAKYFSVVSWGLIESSINQYITSRIMFSDAFDHFEILIEKYRNNSFNFKLPEKIDVELEGIVIDLEELAAGRRWFTELPSPDRLRIRNSREVQDDDKKNEEIQKFNTRIVSLKTKINNLFNEIEYYFDRPCIDEIKRMGNEYYTNLNNTTV